MNKEELRQYSAKLLGEKEELQQRIDKAIKYCYELQERYCHSALFDDLVASKIYEISEKQLNILKGEDKE